MNGYMMESKASSEAMLIAYRGDRHELDGLGGLDEGHRYARHLKSTRKARRREGQRVKETKKRRNVARENRKGQEDKKSHMSFAMLEAHVDTKNNNLG